MIYKIKIDFEELVLEGVDWIHLAQNRASEGLL
jgi:hypothetical protein